MTDKLFLNPACCHDLLMSKSFFSLLPNTFISILLQNTKNKLLEVKLLRSLRVHSLIETTALEFLQHTHIDMLYMLQSFTLECLEQWMGESKPFMNFLIFSWSLNSQ